MDEGRLRQWKDISSTIESLITIVAIIVGGIWAYKGFIEQRLNHPRLQITQKISHVRLSESRNMLVVDETLTNVGTVLLRLRSGGVRVVTVLPLPENVQRDTEIHWPIIDSDKGDVWKILDERQKLPGDQEIAIEPGESDQIHNEFMVPSSVEVVTVVSYIRNPKETTRLLFWRSTDMYDFRDRRQIGANPKAEIGSQRTP